MAAKSGDTLTKTVWQYTKILPEETMQFLREIAADYHCVKNYTFERYSGIKSLSRLTPVYDIMGEVRHSGIRARLCLPSAYFDPAIVEAVSDIKGMWGVLKNRIQVRITSNENLSDADRLYLRTVLKLDRIYAAVLNRQPYEMPKKAQGLDIDVQRLNNILCRLTRKYLTKPTVGRSDVFSITPGGYSYRDGAICIASRVHGQRMELPLKDTRTSDRQIRICIRENDAALAIPVETRIKRHEDYGSTIYVHIGCRDMFTLSNGNIYGKSLDDITAPETERLAEKNRERTKARMIWQESLTAGEWKKADNIEANNLGLEKYNRQKEKECAKTKSFINTEINRMFRDEKPGKIVITKPVTANRTKFISKSANRKMTRGFSGYIRERLTYKCQVNSIELVEINSKGTGSVCSNCGAKGKREAGLFVCGNCGYWSAIPLNGAKNIEQKYNKNNKADFSQVLKQE